VKMDFEIESVTEIPEWEAERNRHRGKILEALCQCMREGMVKISLTNTTKEEVLRIYLRARYYVRSRSLPVRVYRRGCEIFLEKKEECGV